MDGFKPVVKMKAGGSVAKAVEKCKGGRMKEGGKVMHDDVKEDKKLIKKAFSIHDDQLHEGKTDLSALKKGGRCKKDGGSVRKYKAGGEVKKMAIGGLTDPATQALVNADVLRKRRAMMPGAAATPTAPLAQPAPQGMTPTPQNIGATTGPIMKRGGKVRK